MASGVKGCACVQSDGYYINFRDHQGPNPHSFDFVLSIPHSHFFTLLLLTFIPCPFPPLPSLLSPPLQDQMRELAAREGAGPAAVGKLNNVLMQASPRDTEPLSG